MLSERDPTTSSPEALMAAETSHMLKLCTAQIDGALRDCDAAIERVHGLELNDITPTAHLLGCFLRVLDELLPRLLAVAADVEDDAGDLGVALEDEPVHDELEVAQGLAGPADEPARIFGLDIEQDLVLHIAGGDGDGEAEMDQQLFEGGLGVHTG